jgi:hypothetical protein
MFAAFAGARYLSLGLRLELFVAPRTGLHPRLRQLLSPVVCVVQLSVVSHEARRTVHFSVVVPCRVLILAALLLTGETLEVHALMILRVLSLFSTYPHPLPFCCVCKRRECLYKQVSFIDSTEGLSKLPFFSIGVCAREVIPNIEC